MLFIHLETQTYLFSSFAKMLLCLCATLLLFFWPELQRPERKQKKSMKTYWHHNNETHSAVFARETFTNPQNILVAAF